MIVMAAVDDRNGMMFNNRRQSQDRVLREKVLDMAGGSRLWMSRYTAKQFADRIPAEAAAGPLLPSSAGPADPEGPQIIVDDEFPRKAGAGEYCFAEDILPEEEKMEEVILFRWNRAYPGDRYFPVDLGEWKVEVTEEFAGYSHERITKEVYARAQGDEREQTGK